MRLIDADSIPYEEWECGDITLYITNKESIEELSTVDAVPVVHGRWKLVKLWTGLESLYCSVCNHETNIASNYCPFCGARMDEV